MAEDAVTFESARREEAEEVEESGEEPFYAEETPVIPDDEDLEERVDELLTILSSSPDQLSKVGRSVSRTIDERRTRISNEINIRNSSISQALSELSGELEDSESSLDLLNIIAESNLLLAERLDVLGEIQLNTLSAIFDIVGAVEPFTSITVSGTNDIEDADTAELVVPESDDTNIPTRLLLIKASQSNTDEIAFGDDETEPTSGFILDNGDSIALNIDLRNVVLYMASESSGQTVELLGLR